MTLPYCTCIVYPSGWRITAYCLFHDQHSAIYWKWQQQGCPTSPSEIDALVAAEG